MNIKKLLKSIILTSAIFFGMAIIIKLIVIQPVITLTVISILIFIASCAKIYVLLEDEMGGV